MVSQFIDRDVRLHRRAFRTLVPGEYSPRLRHIHFKVFLASREYLTSYIYFNLPGDTVRPSRQELVMPVRSFNHAEGFRGRFDIVLDRGRGGLQPTASQGLYYPRADVSRYVNDLVVR